MEKQHTAQDAINEFKEFYQERADAGVWLAKSITNVELEDGVLTVTFDPTAAGLPEATLTTVSPFSNLAEFAGNPIAFSSEQGDRLRKHVQAVTAKRADGKNLGTLSAADLYKIGTGEDLPK